MNCRWIMLSCLLGLASLGCITSAGGQLAPITPVAPAVAPSIEYTVGNFEFTLEGGKMVTSNKAGTLLSDAIFDHWKEKGYISSYKYVEAGSFSSSSNDRVTLSGSQYGDSSIALQILSGATLLLIPYTVDTKYDVQFTLSGAERANPCSAEVADSYYLTAELFLIFALPVAGRGAERTIEGMGDHLYQQLQAECGFGAS